MPENIDYKFISNLEGGSKTVGYVPAVSVSKSGVTIATGFDLGQRKESDLKTLGFTSSLIKKLKPFLLVKGTEAKELLKKTKLVITSTEANTIDKAVKLSHVSRLKAKYNSAAKNSKKFGDIPTQAQTVIASVSFQYGTNLDLSTPNFWKAVISQDWTEAVKLLKNFGDAYPTRRNKEASLLEKTK